MGPTRAEVYNAIDSERDYQDNLPPERTEKKPGETRTVGEYLTLLDYYVRKAQDQWTKVAGDEQALHEIRKIAAITVHCMEDNGAPHRV